MKKKKKKTPGIWGVTIVDAKSKEHFAFVNPTLVSKAGMRENTKENRFLGYCKSIKRM